MSEYRAPGTYIEEIGVLPASVVPVPTAVPAFIGCTEKANGPGGEDLTRSPVRITSLADYQGLFGSESPHDVAIAVERCVDVAGTLVDVAARWTPVPAVPEHLLPYAIRHFYANGGGPCIIYSLGPFRRLSLHDFTSAITALEADAQPTLLAFPDAVTLSGSEYGALVGAAIESCARTQDRFTIADVPGAQVGAPDATALATTFRGHLAGAGAHTLRFGAAYLPYLITDIPLRTSADHVTLTAFDTVTRDAKGSETARIPLPGAAGSRLSSPSLDLERRDAATWQAIASFLATARVTLPPSPAMAGVYATVDASRGVWKAPANVAVAGVTRPALDVTNEQQQTLNVDAGGKSINVIRHFPGRGTLVWGARTLDGNSNDWRYVNVRRFATFLEQSITRAVAPFSFEPNEARTWTRVRGMLENFLTSQWQAGALQGATTKDAFAVKVGLGTTMTAQDLLDGRMRIMVMVAVVRPAEFLVLQFEQRMPA